MDDFTWTNLNSPLEVCLWYQDMSYYNFLNCCGLLSCGKTLAKTTILRVSIYISLKPFVCKGVSQLKGPCSTGRLVTGAQVLVPGPNTKLTITGSIFKIES